MAASKEIRGGLPFFARLNYAFLLSELSRQYTGLECKLEEYHN